MNRAAEFILENDLIIGHYAIVRVREVNSGNYDSDTGA